MLPSSTASWPSPTASPFSSRPSISNSTPSPCRRPPTPFPHPFANPIPQPSTRFSSKEQHVHHSITSFPIRFLSATQKQSSKAQPRCFTSSPVSPITPPFQRHSFDFPSVCPPVDTSQPCPDDQGSPKKPPSPIVVFNISNTSSSNCNPSISPPPTLSRELCQYPASFRRRPPTSFCPEQQSSSLVPPYHQHENFRGRQLQRSWPSGVPKIGRGSRSSSSTCHPKTDPMVGKDSRASSSRFNTTPTLSGSRPTRIPSKQQPSIILLESCFPQKHENHLDEAPLSQNRIIATQCSGSSNSAYTSDARDSGNLKDKAGVGAADGQDAKEIEVAAEGEQVTEVLCTCSLPVQLTAAHGERVTMLSRMASPSMASKPTSTTRACTKTSPPSTGLASQPTSTAPYISDLTRNFHRGSAVLFLHSIPSPSSSHNLDQYQPALCSHSSMPTYSKR